jgi:hypothetical protein
MPVCGPDPRVADRVLAPRYAHEMNKVHCCRARDGAAARSSRERLRTGTPAKSTAFATVSDYGHRHLTIEQRQPTRLRTLAYQHRSGHPAVSRAGVP